MKKKTPPRQRTDAERADLQTIHTVAAVLPDYQLASLAGWARALRALGDIRQASAHDHTAAIRRAARAAAQTTRPRATAGKKR